MSEPTLIPSAHADTDIDDLLPRDWAHTLHRANAARHRGHDHVANAYMELLGFNAENEQRRRDAAERIAAMLGEA